MSESARQLDIALVGCGDWGRHILRDLVQCGTRVIVVARSLESRARAEAGGAHRIVESIQQLARLDGAIVATPALLHLSVIDDLQRHQPGLPIYCEKPLCIDPDQADRAAVRYADHVFVMHKWRYHPGIVALGEIARSGELGPVHGLCLTRVQWGHTRRDVDAVATLLPHDFSIALEILGHIPRPRDACIDWVAGEAASIWARLGDQPWLVMHDSVRELTPLRQCQLHCRDGVARLGDSYDNQVEIVRASDVPTNKIVISEKRNVSDDLPLRLQIEAFLAWIRRLAGPPKSRLVEEAAIIRAIHDLRRMANPM